MPFLKIGSGVFSKFALRILLLYVAAASSPGLAGVPPTHELKDATGAKVRVSVDPKRVVVLAPSLAELAAEVLGEDWRAIKGVSDFTDHPDALKPLPRVGSYVRVNIEKIAALNPDLILATTEGNAREQIEQLRLLGFPVFTISTHTLQQVKESFELVGRALGRSAKGQQLKRNFEKDLKSLAQRAESRGGSGCSRKKILVQVGVDPLVVAGAGSFLTEGLDLMGFQNVYSDLKQAFPRPALEDVIHRNPDVILLLPLGSHLERYRRAKKEWEKYKVMSAVRSGRVLLIEGSTLMRPTPRFIGGLHSVEKRLCKPNAT